MAYKLSERKQQNRFGKKPPQKADSHLINWTVITIALTFFGIFSLLTAWHFSNSQGKAALGSFSPFGKTSQTQLYILDAKRKNQVFKITVTAKMPSQAWATIDGEILNSKQEYLFSFGKELWHESGRDYDGSWTEQENSYAIDITVKDKGTHYLRFTTESSKPVPSVNISIETKNGSSLPHKVFGVILLLLAIVANGLREKAPQARQSYTKTNNSNNYNRPHMETEYDSSHNWSGEVIFWVLAIVLAMFIGF